MCVCVLEILFLYNKIRCLYYRNINFHIHIEILQNFYNCKHHFPLFLILKIIKTICIDLKGKKSSRQFIVEHWNMSSARQKFWFQIRRFERGWERKKKGVVLKYSYRLPCDVDRGSTGTDNTAVDSIFEFKEPARGLGWTCPHIPLLSLFFIERHIVERFNVRMVHAGFSMFRPKWWKVVINFIFITFDRSDSNTRVLARKLCWVWSLQGILFRGMFRRQMEFVWFVEW